MACWNTYEIEAMSEEDRARNVCLQLRQEVVQWNRPLGYQGKPVRRSQYLPKDVTLLMGGGSGRQWVQVERRGLPVGPRYNPAKQCDALLAEIMSEKGAAA